MDTIKQKINKYIQLKDTLKSINEEKKEIEKSICDYMADNNLSSIELPNETVMNYSTKDSITLLKNKK